ncbi:Dihydrolipoamide acetyltransferase component of pyruvate dehydrogenase complex {ECO:0000256/RuleBase:RU003423} {ECO:0000256/RuleBase:RU003423} [Serendipita indica DSM 11827]|uniref:Dihydrolipoamide acetyltransferase component of pyruvate dehydrogenase complex n=1 Tax=Serendipita indica (strain DSM 11827) TaxID=1109443 RepID=G4T8S7_SERID|nr:Dihydrolipoamide acetyltransferase component of pyruvate dehydrogenase complex {ECO:0000256/RuleBase:RU003423} {ECO:0000256/RuleBase:RU003423} [Serendipita indica DSM 11827]CCA67719.1 related to lipoamide acyltransferase component of branched-chain alpha-keto acid dehydrogenase complex, mitochondrial precursor [Serendipita indica DSM 11827]
MLARISPRHLLTRRPLSCNIVLPYVRFASRKTIRPFLLADIGEGITECEVLKWSVQPSSSVQTFDPLCEVQSDKASVEITSPFDGVIKEILVKEGEIAKVGAELCLIEVTEEGAEAEEQSVAAVPKQTTSARVSVESETFKPPLVPSASPRKRHPLDPSNEELSSPTAALALPSVRHFARQNGISDLSVLAPGSGTGGRIEKADVEAYLARKSQPRDTTTSAASGVRLEDTHVELGRTRYAMWKSMTKSLEIPHFGYSSTLDLTALNALLPSMNSYIPPQFNPPPTGGHPPAISPQGIWGSSPPLPAPAVDPNTQYHRLTILPLLLKALSRAMQEWPIFRSSLNPMSKPDDRPSVTIRSQSDIAVAVSTTSGLYTPVLQSVETKTPYEIMGELRRFQALGRKTPAGFTPKELPKRGATISVSNVGAIGKGEWAAPLLVPGGGVAIVAIGRAKWVERDGHKRLEVGVSWSADHRIVEGAEMAAFVESWRSWVEEPARLIGDGR